jgi:hypothetical protein
LNLVLIVLKAWIIEPAEARTKKPAVLFLHGGFAFGLDDWKMAEPYRAAGYVVMAPMLRGENGQAGFFSMFYDELNDVLALPVSSESSHLWMHSAYFSRDTAPAALSRYWALSRLHVSEQLLRSTARPISNYSSTAAHNGRGFRAK